MCRVIRGHRSQAVLAFVICFACIVCSARASWCQHSKLTAPQPDQQDRFGVAVAIHTNTAVVGAYFDDGPTNNYLNSGCAYVYNLDVSGWVLGQTLYPSDPSDNACFGFSVAIDNDTMVVGSYSDNDLGENSGSAYVFTRQAGTWTEQQKLTAPDGAPEAYFGYSVAIAGNTIVVGAYQHATTGAVYVYTNTGSAWLLQQKIIAPDAAATDHFGCSVAIYGDTIIVGARGNDTMGINAGAVYIYTRTASTWSFQQKLTASDAAAYDRFGACVAIYNDTVLIGAYFQSHSGLSGAGAAYVFTRAASTWSQQQKLTDSEPNAGEFFGRAVAITDQTIIVGSQYDVVDGNETGSAFSFTWDGTSWSNPQRITALDGAKWDNFGWSVSAWANWVIVGAYGDDDSAESTGSAYLFAAAPDADLNRDCTVDFIDFSLLAGQYQQPPAIPSADIWPAGGDNLVDLKDLQLLLQSWLWQN